MGFRIGHGFDIHRLVPERELWLGGVLIPYDKGLSGHSDADVLIHALCDAILGSMALGDIGTHFPDTDPAYKGIASTLLLERTVELIRAEGARIENIDTTICLQEPKIKPRIPEMREKLARIMGITPSQVSVKATTEEKLGFTGREEGVSAYAVVLVRV